MPLRAHHLHTRQKVLALSPIELKKAARCREARDANVVPRSSDWPTVPSLPPKGLLRCEMGAVFKAPPQAVVTMETGRQVR